MAHDSCPDSNEKYNLKISPSQKTNSIHFLSKDNFESECFRSIQVINFYTYLLFMNPCKIVLPLPHNPVEQVNVVSNLWRKRIFVILQVAFLSIGVIPSWTRIFTGKNVSEDPVVLYTFVATTAWTMACLLWPVIIYTKRHAFQKLVNSSYKLHSKTTRHLWRTEIVRWVVLSCIALTLIAIGFGLDNADLIFHEKIQLLIFSQFNNLPIIREIIHAIIKVGEYYLCLLNWIVFLPSTCACLVMYELSTKLLNKYSKLESFESGDMTMVIQNYKEVKSLISGLNEITSSHNILLMVSLVAELCTDFTALIGDETDTNSTTWNWLTRAVMICSFSWSFIIYCIAATSHKNRIFGECLYTHVGGNVDLRDAEKIELVLMLTDLIQNPLGLKVHGFVISFSLLATVFSSILTYIFVLLQFKK